MSAALEAGNVDVHCHVAPYDFPTDPSGVEARWPCMACAEASRRRLMIDGRVFRELDDRSWSVSRRVETMDEESVAAQILSPMPELLSYWFNAQAAARMCDHVNAAIADMVAAAPTRFRGLGMVPMQDPDSAVRALTDLKQRFGLDGIEIGSNILGAQIGEPRFAPVWEALEALGLAVFVHALHPLATRNAWDPLLTPLAGFPLDTGLAAASILRAGVMAKHPRLRIGFSHGGGALGALLGRLDQGWRVVRDAEAPPEPPSVWASRMYYDSNVYDGAYLKHLATHMAPGHVFLGTDYPYDIMQADPAGYLLGAGLPTDVLESVQSGAARRFIGLA